MTQLIYAVSALAVITLFAIGIQRAGFTGEQEMYISEARARMFGVARETVERISRMDMPFDDATDPDRGANGKTYPYVDSPNDLSSVGAFGGCGVLSSCLDIDDFHGMSVVDSAQGIPLMLDFEVAYVDTLSGVLSGTATFAKQLTVKVSTGALRVNGDSLAVSYSRIFVYPNTIDFARGVASKL